MIRIKQIAILLYLIGHLSYGQIFPVQVTPQLIPPYSLLLSEYGTATSERLVVNLLLTDITESNRQVQLRLFIESNSGLQVQSNEFVIGALPVTLEGGTLLRLTNVDLRPFFRLENLRGISPQEYSNQLPEGLYNFCFEVYDVLSGQQISNRSCATAYLVLNEPPFLNLPNRGEQVNMRDPQNIVFQWTPRHLNATNVSYEFTLAEIWDNQMDPQAAFLASRPLFQTTTFANTLLYGPGETPLLPNKTYAWQVRALVDDGISETSVFRNNGFSEIYHFHYNDNCSEPLFAVVESDGPNTAKVMWTGIDHIRYNVQYRKKSADESETSTWVESGTINERTTLYNLEPEVTYEYRLGGKCTENGGYAYTQIFEFMTQTSVEDSSSYTCGIPSEIEIENQKPLESLIINDVFTAGDFPVTVKDVTSGNTTSEASGTGTFSGWGYIVVPYLQDTKIKVDFENIRINTDYQLIEGELVTSYDKNWGGVDDVSDELMDIGILEKELEEDSVATGVIQNETLPSDTANVALVSTNLMIPSDTISTSEIPDSLGLPNEMDPILAGNPTVTPGGSATPSEVPGNTENTGRLMQIRLDGTDQLYSDGDVITMKFNPDDLLVSLALTNRPDSSQSFLWHIYEDNTEITYEQGVVNNLNNWDDHIELNLKDRHGMVAVDFSNQEGEKVIEVFINITKKEFKFLELTAYPKDDPDRIAKSGETLYIIDNEWIGPYSSKKIKYRATIKPNLNPRKYSKNDISWTLGDQVNANLGGKKYIVRNLYERDAIIATMVSAGFPSVASKRIDVKWIDKDKRTVKVVPGAFVQDMEFLIERFKILEPYLKKLAGKNIKIKPSLSTTGERLNEEDKSSRFYNEVRKGRLSAAIELQLEIAIPGLSVAIPKIGTLGFYTTISGGAELRGDIVQKRRSDLEVFVNDKSVLKLLVYGGTELGGKMDFLPGLDIITFQSKVYGKAKLVGGGQVQINEDWSWESSLLAYLDPLIGGVKGTAKIDQHTLLDLSMELEVMDRIHFFP